MRPALSASVSAAAMCLGASCSGYEVPVTWTIDGREPVAVCDSLPDGTDVHFIVRSRDVASATGAAITETAPTAACADGGAVLATGPFAEISAQLHSDGVTVGVSAELAVAPGAHDEGVDDGDVEGVFDIRVTQGAVAAELTVVGQSCAAAGADSFTVSLFTIPEPRTVVPVDGATDVEVLCEDGAAVFRFGGLQVGGQYVVQARATAGGSDYGTPSSGRGFVAAAASFVTIDLQAR